MKPYRHPLSVLITGACTAYSLTRASLLGRGKERELSRRRQALFYVAHDVAGFSMSEIARYAHRDHTTVLHGIRVMRRLRAERDHHGRMLIAALLREVRGFIREVEASRVPDRIPTAPKPPPVKREPAYLTDQERDELWELAVVNGLSMEDASALMGHYPKWAARWIDKLGWREERNRRLRLQLAPRSCRRCSRMFRTTQNYRLCDSCRRHSSIGEAA